MFDCFDNQFRRGVFIVHYRLEHGGIPGLDLPCLVRKVSRK